MKRAATPKRTTAKARPTVKATLGTLTVPAKGGGVMHATYLDDVSSILVRQGKRRWYVPLPLWLAAIETVKYR